MAKQVDNRVSLKTGEIDTVPLFDIRVDKQDRAYRVSIVKDSTLLYMTPAKRRFDFALDEVKYWIARQGGANKV